MQPGSKINPGKIVVAGDSAGATTATAISMKTRDLERTGNSIADFILSGNKYLGF